MLPNADNALVEETKILNYLLSPDHPDGRSKAEFFERFGFRRERWEDFAAALRQHGRTQSVAKTVQSLYGTRYVVEGGLETPEGRRPMVRTVWIIEIGNTIPRLVTAYGL